MHLREAHGHIAALGRALALLDLARVTSVRECLDALAREASRLAPGQWVLATGARIESWVDRRWPTRDELDRAVPAHACAVRSFDYHALTANTPAFRAAGLQDSAPDTPRAVMVRDASGRPAGLLLEDHASRVWNSAPEPDIAARLTQTKAALDHLRALGYTEVHDMLATLWLGPLLSDLDDRGELPISVGLYAPYAELDVHLAASKHYSRDRVRLLGGKLFADGTLNSATAWMLSPYRDPLPNHPSGTPLLTPRDIADALRRTYALGLGLAVHAIGDGAVRAVLDTVELSRLALHAPGADLESWLGVVRIEHAELIDERDMARFAALGVVASVQPCHLLYDAEVLRRRLPHRLSRVLPLRDLLASGLEAGRTLVFGSDVPIVRADPIDSVTAAVHRARPAGSPLGPPTTPIAPEQALDEHTARNCFTHAR